MRLCLGKNVSTKLNGYLSVDLNGSPDIKNDIFVLDLVEENSCEIIVASHVLEHGYYQGDGPDKIKDVVRVLELWKSKLIDGGRIFIAVPNFDFIVNEYLKNREMYFYNNPDILGCMLGGCEVTQKHNMVFNFYALKFVLEKAGFVDVYQMKLGDQEFLPGINTASTDMRSLNVGAKKCIH